MTSLAVPPDASAESLAPTGGLGRERVIVLALCAIYLVVNLITASRSPTIWMDETMFDDPAANVYFGNGFRSSAFMHQTKEQPFAYNNMAYEAMLIVWMKLFGFTPTACRSLNYVLLVATALLTWAAARRS